MAHRACKALVKFKQQRDDRRRDCARLQASRGRNRRFR
jgi:hypothetical protein